MSDNFKKNRQARADKNFFALWGSVSIKFKLTAIVTVFLISALMLISFTFYRIDVTERRAYSQSEKIFLLNNFISQIDKSKEFFAKYLENPSQNKLLLKQDVQAVSDQLQIFSAYDWSVVKVGEQQHLLSRAVKNIMSNYADVRSEAIRLVAIDGEDKARLFYKNTGVDVATYLSAYTDNLLMQILTDNQVFHEAQQKTLKIQYNCAVFIIVVILFGMGAMIYQLFKGITLPVIAISKAATEFASGKFDVPDINVSSRDEIFQLAQAFNEMKVATKIYIQTLYEKNDMATQLQQKKLEATEMEKLLQEAKMQQLRNQINPHFLFNTLNTIARTARVENAQRSEALIKSLSRLFRYGLKTDDVVVTIDREMNIINDYISIQQTRFGSRVGMCWRVDDDVDVQTEMLPPFTLQPLVENAIIHGLEKKIEGGTVRIRIHYYGDYLYIIISDNGVGMDKETLSKVTIKKDSNHGHVSGIGLPNVIERIKMIYGDCQVVTRSKKGLGTSVTIKIPKNNNLKTGGQLLC